jgi:tryptophan synthase alpha chain
MSKITEKFKNLGRKKEGALIGYLTLGDPDLSSSMKLMQCLAQNVDILEIGIPFSDPIADGPTIQAAMDRALRNNVYTINAFDAVRELREKGLQKPLVFMTYYNIVLQYGEESFLRSCEETGVDGLLVSDLPLEESEKVSKLCKHHNIDLIFLLALTTPPDRAKKIIAQAKGFIYLISLLGVTGERERVEKETLKIIKNTLELVGSLPLVVGFGISKREHVKDIIAAGAQGVVVGSAFVNLVAKHGKSSCKELERLSEELKKGTR